MIGGAVRTQDDGFTLVELLIAVAISVIVLGGIIFMFIAMLGNNQVITARVQDAAVGQQLDVMLPDDLESTFPNLIDTSSGTASGCSSSSGTNVLQLQWQQSLPTPTVTFVASYRLVPYTLANGQPSKELQRFYCSGANPASGATQIRTIATNLSAASASVSGGVITLTTTSLNGVVYQYVVQPRTAPAGGVPGSPPPTPSPTATLTDPSPSIKKLVMLDKDANGLVDEVDATLTTTISSTDMSNCTAIGLWSLANVPSSGSLQSVSGSGSSIVLKIKEGNKPADTSVSNFTVSFTSGSGCDVLPISNAAPQDGAGPVLTQLATKDGDGKMETGDTLTLTFSETLNTSPLPTNTTVTEKSDGTLNITGITNGDVTTGTSHFTGTNQQASFPASVVPTGATLKLTLLTPCSGNCSSLAGGSGDLAFVPAASITDAAGNAAVGTFTQNNVSLF